jgi:hypothetical protein
MFNIGDRVNRKETRETVGASVIGIDGDNYELAYDEGGTGWWPAEALESVEDHGSE